MSSMIGTREYCSINVHLHQGKQRSKSYCSENVHAVLTLPMIGPSRADDMESLAYTVIRLLRGSLPWARLPSAEVFRTKQLWSGTDLGFGYPPVFGDFVNYTRGLEFEDEPDYARWTESFQSLVTSCDAEVVVGRSLRDKPDSSHAQLLSEPPKTKSAWTTPHDIEHFALDTFPLTRVPTSRDLIGDEKAIVRRKLARIETLPKMEPFCEEKEFMLTQEQEDHDIEEFGRDKLAEIDEFWLQ